MYAGFILSLVFGATPIPHPQTTKRQESRKEREGKRVRR